MLNKKESAIFGRKHYDMYTTNLTDSQWEGISKLLDVKRKRKYSLRDIIDGILYISKTGVQWALLPKDFPPVGIVHYYFKTWGKTGVWQSIILDFLKKYREITGKDPEPTAVIIDSQSIKNSERGVQDKGFDGHKKVKGRKRHVATDSNGRLITCVVGPANEHDLQAGKRLIEKAIALNLPNIKIVVADGAYTSLVEWAKEEYGVDFQISMQIKEKKFIPVAHRWKVERFISWMMWSRRLSRDYELNIESSQAWILVCGITNLLRFF